LYLTLLDGEIQEVKRAQPGQFNRTFYRTNRIKVAGSATPWSAPKATPTGATAKMTICAMQQVVSGAAEDAQRARREARETIVSDLRRLVRLQPYTPPVAAATDPAQIDPDPALLTGAASASLYCRFFGILGKWLAPAEAQAAQDPHRSPPPSALPPDVHGHRS